jgi:hypothetical protein
MDAPQLDPGRMVQVMGHYEQGDFLIRGWAVATEAAEEIESQLLQWEAAGLAFRVADGVFSEAALNNGIGADVLQHFTGELGGEP